MARDVRLNQEPIEVEVDELDYSNLAIEPSFAGKEALCVVSRTLDETTAGSVTPHLHAHPVATFGVCG